MRENELREALDAYREAAIAADHCYGEGNESELLGAEIGARDRVTSLFVASVQQARREGEEGMRQRVEDFYR